MSGSNTKLGTPEEHNQVNEQQIHSSVSTTTSEMCLANEVYSNTPGVASTTVALVLYKPTSLQGRLSLLFQRLHGIKSNASHCALLIGDTLVDPTFGGIYITEGWGALTNADWCRVVDDDWCTVYYFNVISTYSELVMDRVLTLCCAGSKVTWSSLIDALKGKDYRGMTCVTFCQTVLGIDVDPNIKFPEQLLEQVQTIFPGHTIRQ